MRIESNTTIRERRMIETIEIKSCDQDSEEKKRRGETVRFGLDGHEYETELCTMHVRAFEKMTQEYQTHARRQTSSRVHKETPRTPARRKRLGEIRAWARENGMEINNRGRIPDEVTRKYEASFKG
jgi:Lsr2